MDYYSLSDLEIAANIGNRLRSLRLRRNITQQALADATQLSLNTIKALEAGQGKLSTLIAVLRELNALDQLTLFIPEPTVSPLQLVKMQGKKRERATGTRGDEPKEDHDEW